MLCKLVAVDGCGIVGHEAFVMGICLTVKNACYVIAYFVIYYATVSIISYTGLYGESCSGNNQCSEPLLCLDNATCGCDGGLKYVSSLTFDGVRRRCINSSKVLFSNPDVKFHSRSYDKVVK